MEHAYWLQAGYISSSPAVSARLVTQHGLEASYPCGYSRKNILLVDPVTLYECLTRVFLSIYQY